MTVCKLENNNRKAVLGNWTFWTGHMILN